jgi:hypothetical protein
MVSTLSTIPVGLKSLQVVLVSESLSLTLLGVEVCKQHKVLFLLVPLVAIMHVCITHQRCPGINTFFAAHYSYMVAWRLFIHQLCLCSIFLNK